MTDTQLLPYQIDNSELFSRIRTLPRAVWLDSQRSDRREILTALPRASGQWNNGQCLWDGCNSLGNHFTDAFSATRALIAHCLPPTESLKSVTNGEFNGGIIGFWSYPGSSNYKPSPRMPQSSFAWYDWWVTIDHQQQESLLCFADSCPLSTRSAVMAALALPPPPPSRFELLAPFQPLTSIRNYAKAVQRIKAYIRAGDSYQVNYTQAVTSPCRGSSWAAYLALRAHSRSPYSAYLELPQGEILCLSPEQFISVSNGKVTSRPIKGTRPRVPGNVSADQKQADELAASPKDRAENVMITDLLRNDLGRHALPGSVKVTELFGLHSFSLVHHLISTVEATLSEGIDTLTVLADAFPGGSITGAPKRRAMEIIDELEVAERSIYCGSIGWLSASGDMMMNIAIRTLVRERDQLWAWAGGGITADSVWQEEYRECINKIGGLLRQLEAEFLVR